MAALSGCGSQAEAGGAAAPEPSPSALAEQCLGALENMETTDKYMGLSEDEALAQAQTASDGGGRIVARDGECLGTSRDLRGGRVNFVVEDGTVVWSAVERLPS